MDVPVDLSNVLFITSANSEARISKPLLDRMDKIYLSNYTKTEKLEIFTRHLLKRAMEATGVKPDQFVLPPETVDALVEEYNRGEPGVRHLQKYAFRLLEKVAFKIVAKEGQLPIYIGKEALFDYLGNSHFLRKNHLLIGVGVAISLGEGGYGSRLTYIEAFQKSYIPHKKISRGALLTGSLSDVFKEAMNISYTFARNFLEKHFSNRYLFENEVHIHAPEGGFKKDGSTDSMTTVAALVSLALKTKVKSEVALTGEITLQGLVLRTERIKEKVIIAKQERIKEVILPIQNQPDVQDLEDDVKAGI